MKNFLQYFKKNNVIKLLICIGLIFIVIGGFSFAYLNFILKGEETNLVQSGCLQVDFTESNVITLSNAAPITNAMGKNSTPYVFTITNSCTLDAYYETTFNVLTTSATGNENKVKLYLTGGSYFEPTLVSNFSAVTLENTPTDVRSSYLIDSGYLEVGETKTFNLRMWIDYDATDFSNSFNNKIIVTATSAKGSAYINTTGYQVLSQTGVTNRSTTNPNFAYVAPSSSNLQTSGLFKITGISNSYTYYFRGTVSNNYIKFGTYQANTSVTYQNSSGENVTVTHSAGDDIIWRIVRINEDGSLRIILNDFIGVSQFNETVNSLSYTGYIYEKAGDTISSNIKTSIDNWYETHLATNYGSYISNSNFCLDNSYITKNGSNYYTSYTKNITSTNPTFKCNTNGVYTNKIGLLSATELAVSGNVYNVANTENYLYESDEAYNISYSNSAINFAKVNISLGVRPVISLSNNLILSGTGTSSDPYMISDIRN